MPSYILPQVQAPPAVEPRTALLVASGDLRESANRECWPAQSALEAEAAEAFAALGWTLRRAHSVGPEGHGFLATQRQGMEVFKGIHRDAPLVVAEAVWQYSYHVLPGLMAHAGPILVLANWSGEWPGLVGALNLVGSLTRAGKPHSFLWAEDFGSDDFRAKLGQWVASGRIEHDLSHLQALDATALPGSERALGAALATELRTTRAIMGVFDEGCMGMYNAIIPDHLLAPLGVYKERLSQSALYYAMTQVPDAEAQEIRDWLDARGMTFHTGSDEATELTDVQILLQCKMYIAALRIADDFGCDLIGIQYQQGLKDLAPASDLAEGLLNNSDRPPVRNAAGELIRPGKPMTHFNEVDECAGLDALLTQRVWEAMGLPPENTLHDVRWGDRDASGTTDEYVWVFEISGAAPPAHFEGGYAGAHSERQPPMYFRLGGGTLKGVSKRGEVVWSRIHIDGSVPGGKLVMDLGRCRSIELPPQEMQRRWESTTSQWPIMNAVTYGVSRDQFMARHKANHIQVAYGLDAASADRALAAKAAMAQALGIEIYLCGENAAGVPLGEALGHIS